MRILTTADFVNVNALLDQTLGLVHTWDAQPIGVNY